MKLWEQINLSLFFPFLISAVIVLYAIYNLGTISDRVTSIEAADDINISLLELRRYEKNILLFKEEKNLDLFYEYLTEVEKGLFDIRSDIDQKMGKDVYGSLRSEIKTYKESARLLVSSMKTEQKLLEDIRPLGRDIEKDASNREMALELRRHEKNYIIYREQKAVNLLHDIAKKLVSAQPSLRAHVADYLRAFDFLAETEAVKEAQIEKMRYAAVAIEKVTIEFAERKRQAIDKTIAKARKLFITSFVFLVVSAFAVACLFSASVVKTLKTVERSLGRVKEGDFSKGIDINVEVAPQEIVSFVDTYNQVVSDIGDSRAELEKTLHELEIANRELVERQEELVEAKRLTSMRLLASEIAHEINNPLSSLTTMLGMLYEDTKDEEPKREILALMLKETRRCKAVLRELVDFAKKEPLNLREANPRKLVNEAVEIAKRQNGVSGIRLSVSIDALPEKVVLDPVLMYQALVNILTNAFQFTPPGGAVDVTGSVKDGNMCITVRDTGPGIPEDNLPYVFEPFFSTRKDTGGSGIGLAITKKILERHNGSIRAESTVGVGTAFKLSVPLGGAQG